MSKPHLRMVGGRVFQFKSTAHASAWVQEFGQWTRENPAPRDVAVTFREWKERKLRGHAQVRAFRGHFMNDRRPLVVPTPENIVTEMLGTFHEIWERKSHVQSSQ